MGSPTGIATDGFINLPFVTIETFVPAGNRFQDNDDFCNRQRNKTSLVAITLQRTGAAVDTETMGTPAQTLFKYTDEDNISQRFVSRDFIINRVDYKIDGILTEPTQRDKIIEVTNFAIFTHEVLAVNMEPAFKFSGAYRLAYRVHTQRIKTEEI